MHPYIAVPAIALLVLRAWSNNSLTPLGIIVALLTAVIHAIHPWSIFFALLVVFFLGGSAVTKVKHAQKAILTHSSTSTLGGEGPRTHIQVLANSLVASILILLHRQQLLAHERDSRETYWPGCYAWGGDLLVVGIIAQYASAAADTFSSELGILSSSSPRLLTSLTLRRVPPGTNGGITALGTLAGALGGMTIALTSLVLLPLCQVRPSPTSVNLKSSATVLLVGQAGFTGGMAWGWQEKVMLVAVVTAIGVLGSLLDSALGGWFQHSVVDRRTGKVVEGAGGGRVLIHDALAKMDDDTTRFITSGAGLLDNNAVNLLTTALMSLIGMAAASWYWSMPLSSIFTT